MSSSNDGMGCTTVAGWILGIVCIWAAIFGVMCGGKNYKLNCSQNRGVEVNRSIPQDPPVSVPTRTKPIKRK